MKKEQLQNKKVLVEISSRHVHLSEKDFKKLFGKEKKLNKIANLSQPGEFASNQVVSLSNEEKEIKNVRIVGPFRKYSQVEISFTDAYNLNLKHFPKIRLSGDLKGTSKIKVIGEKGNLDISCIIAKRHLHIFEKEAKELGIKNNENVVIKIKGEREVLFKEVITRVSKNYKMAVHLDTDEGNAAGIIKKTFGELILKTNK